MEDDNKIIEETENKALAAEAEKVSEPVKEPVKETVKEEPVNKIKSGKYADSTDHDLLVELVKLEKKTSKRTGIVAFSMVVIAAVVLASAVLIVPKVVTTLTAAETTLEHATNLMGEVNNSLDGMNKMISNVDTVLTDNTEAMSEAIKKISDIDIEGLNDSIKKLNDDGITVLVVEQNANKALKIADRGYVLETGNIVISDTAENMRSNNTVQKAYLGG